MGTFLIALAGASRAAAAAGAVLASGGPAPGERDAVLRSLEEVRLAMQVCWQRARPAMVKVKVAVAASGVVTKATVVTKGEAAQCAAGVLAVSTLAPSAKAWTGVFRVSTTDEVHAADVRTINNELGNNARALIDCPGLKGFSGVVQVTLTVRKDGVVTAATAAVTAGVRDPPMTDCIAGVVRKMKVAPLSADRTVDAPIHFGAGAGAPIVTLDPKLRATHRGPLDATALAAGFKAWESGLGRCKAQHQSTGAVTLRLDIGPDGAVAAARIERSKLEDVLLDACLLDAARALTFAPARRKTTLRYPLRITETTTFVGRL